MSESFWNTMEFMFGLGITLLGTMVIITIGMFFFKFIIKHIDNKPEEQENDSI